jgi:glycosyltransferase involved in cell wall biosynthesis
MNSFVSVIIPCFNAAETIEPTVNSCLAQGEIIKEIIIVDDFSTDESWEVLIALEKKSPALIKIYHNKVKGGNNARNLGYSISTGKYIQWLDADDLLMPGKLYAQCKWMEDHAEADIIYSDWRLQIFDQHHRMSKMENKIARKYEDYLLELLQDNWQPPVSYLLRRSIAEKLHKLEAWNPATLAAQDREYFTMAAIIGANFQYVTGTFSVYIRRFKPSLSRSLHMKDKARIIVKLLLKFKRRIEEGNFPNASKYLKIINTQLLYYSAVFGTQKFKFRFSDIHWSMINGKRSRLKAYMAVLLS